MKIGQFLEKAAVHKVERMPVVDILTMNRQEKQVYRGADLCVCGWVGEPGDYYFHWSHAMLMSETVAVQVVVRSTVHDLSVEKLGDELEVNWEMLDCVGPRHRILQKEQWKGRLH